MDGGCAAPVSEAVHTRCACGSDGRDATVAQNTAPKSSARAGCCIGSSCFMPTVLMLPSITSAPWQVCDQITPSLTGIKAEWTHNGMKSRFGKKRVDTHHMWLDPVIIGGPWLLAGAVIARLLRKRRGGR